MCLFCIKIIAVQNRFFKKYVCEHVISGVELFKLLVYIIEHLCLLQHITSVIFQHVGIVFLIFELSFSLKTFRNLFCFRIVHFHLVWSIGRGPGVLPPQFPPLIVKPTFLPLRPKSSLLVNLSRFLLQRIVVLIEKLH